MVDVHGNHLTYQGFKIAAQLCAEDIGRFITWGEDSPRKKLRVLSRLLLYTNNLMSTDNPGVVQIVFRYPYPSGETTTEVSSTEIVHLWKKIPAPEKTTKEFRFIGVDGDVIVRVELAAFASDFIRKIYDNTPTKKIEYREVGEWKEYDLG